MGTVVTSSVIINQPQSTGLRWCGQAERGKGIYRKLHYTGRLEDEGKMEIVLL